jgi:hypothetical protein
VTARDIVVRIVHDRTGAPLDQRAADGVRTWTSRVRADGEYRIDVVRLAAAGPPAMSYVMVVSLR